MIKCGLGKILKSHSPRCPQKIFLEVFHFFFFFAFESQWTDWTEYELIDLDCGFVINFSVVCLLKSQSQMHHKVEYISQINGGLIMFFTNSRIRFFKIN